MIGVTPIDNIVNYLEVVSLDQQLITDLADALRRLARVRHSLSMGGLTMGEFLLLRLVQPPREETPEGSDSGTTVCVSDLARQLSCSPPAVSRTLRRLEEHGLLKRRCDPADRRTTYVELTPEGQQQLLDYRGEMEALAVRVSRRMGEENLRVLTAQLDRLTDIILEEREKERISC